MPARLAQTSSSASSSPGALPYPTASASGSRSGSVSASTAYLATDRSPPPPPPPPPLSSSFPSTPVPPSSTHAPSSSLASTSAPPGQPGSVLALDPFAPTSWALDPTTWSNEPHASTSYNPVSDSPFRFSPLPLPSPNLLGVLTPANHTPAIATSSLAANIATTVHPQPVPQEVSPSIHPSSTHSFLNSHDYPASFFSLLTSPPTQTAELGDGTAGGAAGSSSAELTHVTPLPDVKPKLDTPSVLSEGHDHVNLGGMHNSHADGMTHPSLMFEFDPISTTQNQRQPQFQHHSSHLFNSHPSAYSTSPSTSQCYSPAEFANLFALASKSSAFSVPSATVTPLAAAGLEHLSDLDHKGPSASDSIDLSQSLFERLQSSTSAHLMGGYAPSAFSFQSDFDHLTSGTGGEDTPATSIDETMPSGQDSKAFLDNNGVFLPQSLLDGGLHEGDPLGLGRTLMSSPGSNDSNEAELAQSVGTTVSSRSSSRKRKQSRAANEAEQTVEHLQTGQGQGQGQRRSRTSSGNTTATDAERLAPWNASRRGATEQSEPSTSSHTTNGDAKSTTTATATAAAKASTSASSRASRKKKSASNKTASPEASSRKRGGSEVPAVEDDLTIRPYACNWPQCPARLRSLDQRSSSRSGSSSTSVPIEDDLSTPPSEDVRFRTIRELREHCAEHTRDGLEGGETPFRCALYPCDKTFKSLAGLRFHFQNASTNGHFFVSCEDEEPATTEEVPPPKKFKLCVQPSGRSEKCPIRGCAKAFRQPAGLSYHLAHTPNHDVSESMFASFSGTLQSKTKWWFAKVGRTFVTG
ncbi:BZ3500_MvSof-1268-A1-R1_Chr2-2g05041 [Microbotryum saponariae]|uniref:BZ3500_MvSof-1268-A1-R1_Chr2-2g05041 protein n=1 Tax=Microbotryum saponariae TaxID=289078 RepID=A0A2X0L2I8_9BASI|nr:BZ3500_MvSof-1268-A1-R1_Chr2-2g05041 [Microbotryum saponariae]SDA00764.1 BZ3501_MvSof-1269-A2-R1_Chr2-2g04715 [Microbotryum saponariae]